MQESIKPIKQVKPAKHKAKHQARLQALIASETPEQTKKRQEKNKRKAQKQKAVKSIVSVIKETKKVLVSKDGETQDKAKKAKPKGTGSKRLKTEEFMLMKSNNRTARKAAKKATKARKVSKKLHSNLNQLIKT